MMQYLSDMHMHMQGLGEQLAYQLSEQGALLILSSRSKERLEASRYSSGNTRVAKS